MQKVQSWFLHIFVWLAVAEMALGMFFLWIVAGAQFGWLGLLLMAPGLFLALLMPRVTIDAFAEMESALAKERGE